MKDYNPSTEYDLKKYYPELFARLNEVRKERMYNSVLKNIKKGKKEGLFRADLDDEIIAKMQTSRFLHMGSDDIIDAEDMSKPKYILELFMYHIRGMANTKGLKILEETLKTFDIQEYL